VADTAEAAETHDPDATPEATDTAHAPDTAQPETAAREGDAVTPSDISEPHHVTDTPEPVDTESDTDADTEVPEAADDGEVADAPEVPDVDELPRFSFFVTSLEAMLELSGSPDGFGGDLRFGEASGLTGADKICTTVAEREMPGAGAKGWRAFLSAHDDGAGNAVHAIDRISDGPWYDRFGRLVASDKDGLLSSRPDGDVTIKNDLPNERGESQRNQPGANSQGTADNHDVLTGSTAAGRLDTANGISTCDDWTSTSAAGRPRLGHSWPSNMSPGWIQAHSASGCPAVINLLQNGPGDRDCVGVGCGGGYGAIYCFADVP
jgi:hypothetical protein